MRWQVFQAIFYTSKDIINQQLKKKLGWGIPRSNHLSYPRIVSFKNKKAIRWLAEAFCNVAGSRIELPSANQRI